MSFVKIRKIAPEVVSEAETGYIYLGYDYRGVWAKDGPVTIWISSGATSGNTSDWIKVVNDLYYSGGKVAVGTNTFSSEALTVNGAIKIGDAAGSAQGTIKYASGDFFGRTASGWVSLTSGGTFSGGTTSGADMFWQNVAPYGAQNLQNPIYINSGSFAPSGNDGVLNIVGKTVLNTQKTDSLYVGRNTDFNGFGVYNVIVTGLTLSSGFAAVGMSGGPEAGMTGTYTPTLSGVVTTVDLAGGLITGIKAKGGGFGTGGHSLTYFPAFYSMEQTDAVLSGLTGATLAVANSYTDVKVSGAITGATLSAVTYIYSNDIIMSPGKTIYTDTAMVTKSGATNVTGMTQNFTIGGRTYYFTNGLLVNIT